MFLLTCLELRGVGFGVLFFIIYPSLKRASSSIKQPATEKRTTSEPWEIPLPHPSMPRSSKILLFSFRSLYYPIIQLREPLTN